MSIIVAVEMSSQPFKSFQFDGILGLGLPGLTMSRTSLDWLATQLLKGFVSISRYRCFKVWEMAMLYRNCTPELAMNNKMQHTGCIWAIEEVAKRRATQGCFCILVASC